MNKKCFYNDLRTLLCYLGWFWGRRFFNFVNEFMLFHYYFSLEKDRAIHLNKDVFPSPKAALCQVWLKLALRFWRRRFFKKSLEYFIYFVIISPWKRAEPFIWTHLHPLHQRMLCAKFGWKWSNGSGEEDENVKSFRTEDRQQVIRRAHLSFQLSWANKNSWVRIFLKFIQLRGHTVLQWYKIEIR